MGKDTKGKFIFLGALQFLMASNNYISIHFLETV